jgi:hypothetical protein
VRTIERREECATGVAVGDLQSRQATRALDSYNAPSPLANPDNGTWGGLEGLQNLPRSHARRLDKRQRSADLPSETSRLTCECGKESARPGSASGTSSRCRADRA